MNHADSGSEAGPRGTVRPVRCAAVPAVARLCGAVSPGAVALAVVGFILFAVTTPWLAWWFGWLTDAISSEDAAGLRALARAQLSGDTTCARRRWFSGRLFHGPHRQPGDPPAALPG